MTFNGDPAKNVCSHTIKILLFGWNWKFPHTRSQFLYISFLFLEIFALNYLKTGKSLKMFDFSRDTVFIIPARLH